MLLRSACALSLGAKTQIVCQLVSRHPCYCYCLRVDLRDALCDVNVIVSLDAFYA